MGDTELGKGESHRAEILHAGRKSTLLEGFRSDTDLQACVSSSAPTSARPGFWWGGVV